MLKLDCRVLAETKNMEQMDWLKSRQQGIGGSDAGAIAGISPYKSALGVFIDKTQPPEPIDNEYMYWGRVMEDVLLDEFKKRTGFTVQRRNAILQHKDHDFILANLDGVIQDEKDRVGILEIKTASEYVKGDWEDGSVPDHYFLQILHYMNVVENAEFAYVVVLVGGNKYKHYKIERKENLDVMAQLLEMEIEFWDKYIKMGVAPPPDGSKDAEDILKSMYPDSEDKEVDLSNMAEVVKEIDRLKASKKDLEDEISLLEQRVKEQMRTAEKALVGDYKVYWKTCVSNRFDTKTFKQEHQDLYEKYSKESKSRRFRIAH